MHYILHKLWTIKLYSSSHGIERWKLLSKGKKSIMIDHVFHIMDINKGDSQKNKTRSGKRSFWISSKK